MLVIGGGASGMTAAIAAARCGAAVTLWERLPRIGKKLLLTGNGRCNLGHCGCEMEHYHGSLPQADAILRRFDTETFFRQLGLLLHCDAAGRWYPCSNTAASVLDALRFELEALGVTIETERSVTALSPQPNGTWRIQAGEIATTADHVILATGGKAAPACGTDGSLFPLLARLGHRIIPPRPALCPIPSDAARLRPLKGMRVHATVSALVDGQVRGSEVGEVQFTEHALSGICLFNLARHAADYGTRMELSLNLLPEHLQTERESMAWLTELLEMRGQRPLGDLLTGLLPRRVAETLVKAAFGTCSQPAYEVLRSDAQTHALLSTLRGWRFPVTAAGNWTQAQVTAGGIAGTDVTSVLASKHCAGLWFCGEVLDVDGDCGGYNLDWAWASGACAGHHAATMGSMAR